MKKHIIYLLFITCFVSCHKDLDQFPTDPDSFTEQDVFDNVNTAKQALAKLYASLSLTGQEGPAGQPDISDIDEGFSQFTRMLFNLNELTTDHAVVAWGDPGLPDLHGQYWSAANDNTEGMYSRLAQGISFCNSFISNAANLSGSEIETFIAEARFLRAFFYYNMIDLFGNVPLTTAISTELPIQSNRMELFSFVENELLEIESLLSAPQSNEYGRVDQVAAWALLSKLYLNAEVWINESHYNECAEYSEKVINSAYAINTNDANGNGNAYDDLFLADNHINGAQNEFIFTATFDGLQSQTYGGSTFLVHASIGGNMDPARFGVNGGWSGLRTTKALVDKFAVNVDALNANLGNTSDWGIVGNSTVNEWNGPDQEMYDLGNDKYALYINFNSGEIKFRFNENWDINYGDDNADGTLEAGGANIVIANPGTYFVEFDLANLTYSISPFTGDSRAMFFSDGQTLEIEDITDFSNGYAVTKFKNVKSDGSIGNDSSGEFADTDLPIIRLPEIIFNYAEAILRGGSGDRSLALSKVNEVRTRAFGGQGGMISDAELTLDFLLNERSRELYWEGQRRTDLVRYNYFTTAQYLWPFKGNVPAGRASDSYRDLFPLPVNIIAINPNLNQNQGY